MIKYTILYKNGKTWNGKAKGVANIPVVPCILLVIHCKDGAKKLYYMDGYSWEHFEEMNPSHVYKRSPNPKSKTKKQKALEDGYHRWIRDWHERGSSDITMQAYKKWLYEQKSSPAIKCFPSCSVGDKIGYYPQGSDELTWCTITEAGHTSPNNIKITAMLPGDISGVDTQIKLSYGEPDKDGFIPWNGGECPVPYDTKVEVKFRSGNLHLFDHPQDFWWGRDVYEWHCDIVAYKLYEVEPKLEKITFPSGATISYGSSKEPWEGIYKPWKEAKLSIPNYPLPIKTTYTFWLGALGELVEDKEEINDGKI